MPGLHPVVPLILDIGLPEMAVIAVVAIFVFGPDKLPELAKQAAQWVKIARRFANQARDELREELGPEYADLELRDLDPRQIVRKHVMEALEDDDEDDEPDEDDSLADGEVPPYDDEAT
ncbi:sec-independent translocase [Nocardioides bruguierae]|uniref:sec-independent translocase n=1 Tax=Nocardioides bruguierae TaxID=2945102 RepID=UPI002021629A|nr:sec-independent translocase [Nocardioides bruguierae]MCL8024953.1 sec-independent translocase [Nocardioides bruguierae]